VVSDIILPPTIELNSSYLDPGQILRAFGQSAPSSTVEVWISPDKTPVADKDILKKTVVSSLDGKWEVMASTNGLKGIYNIKAKTGLGAIGWAVSARCLNAASRRAWGGMFGAD
jgi:hypothetical protein